MNKKSYSKLFRDYPDVLTVTDVSAMLGCSNKMVYRLIKEGRLDSIKIGRANKIAKLSVVQLLMQNSSEKSWTSEKNSGMLVSKANQELACNKVTHIRPQTKIVG